MNKIEELIQQLCPEGVEFKELSEVAEIGTGSSNGNEAIESGKYPLFVRSKFVKKINTFEFDEEAIIIPGEGGIGEIFHFIKGKYALHQRAYRIHIVKNAISTKFIYYYMMSNFKIFILQKAVNATVSSIRKPMIEKFQIPIPPLPIQQEIVNILDSFTQLEAELQAELEARKKQYKYYLNDLLNVEGKEVEWKILGDLCIIGDGLHGTPKYDENGEYFFINGNNLDNGKIYFDGKTKKVDNSMYQKYGISFTKENTVFMSINGTIGSVSFFNNEKIVLGKSVAFFNIKSPELYSKFLFYLFQTDFSINYFEAQKTGSTIKNLGLKALRTFQIPLPSLAEQERITGILNKFDSLVNDISIGLPAEIDGRRKQYNYYRGKLLEFKQLAQ